MKQRRRTQAEWLEEVKRQGIITRPCRDPEVVVSFWLWYVQEGQYDDLPVADGNFLTADGHG